VRLDEGNRDRHDCCRGGSENECFFQTFF
jgi:hypothetical protein